MAASREARSQRNECWRAWMVAAQHGDSGAYTSLLRELVPFVARLVRGRLKHDPGAEDVAQQVLLSVHRARHTFRGESGFEPWLNAIVRNTVINWARGHARELARRSEVEVTELPDPAPTQPPHELSAGLVRALARLPHAQREAVVLLKLEGLSLREAAQRAQVSEGALKLRAHRGYRVLRDQLASPR